MRAGAGLSVETNSFSCRLNEGKSQPVWPGTSSGSSQDLTDALSGMTPKNNQTSYQSVSECFCPFLAFEPHQNYWPEVIMYITSSIGILNKLFLMLQRKCIHWCNYNRPPIQINILNYTSFEDFCKAALCNIPAISNKLIPFLTASIVMMLLGLKELKGLSRHYLLNKTIPSMRWYISQNVLHGQPRETCLDLFHSAVAGPPTLTTKWQRQQYISLPMYGRT